MQVDTSTDKDVSEITPEASSCIALVTFSQQWASIAIVAGCGLLLAAVIIPFIFAARQDARRIQSKNNLKQLGLAFHNYHDTYGQLPIGADVRPNGTAVHGWMIRLLPYFESSPLYSQINWNFPWDHPSNGHLFRFKHPSLLSPNHVDQFTLDGFGLTLYLGNPNVLHRNTASYFSEMTTGTAHNWLVGEVSSGFQPFAYPFNWRELKLPFNDGEGSYGSVNDSTNICLADGPVSTLSQKTDHEIVRQLSEAPPVASGESKVLPSRVFRNSPTSSWTREFFWPPVKTTASNTKAASAQRCTLILRGNSILQIFTRARMIAQPIP